MNEIKCGRIGANTISDCADRAAIAIVNANKQRAVCVSPEGRVTVEYPGSVVEEDLVGIYSGVSRFDLWRQISDDLLAAKVERGISGGTGHRHRVKTGQRRAA